jgi:anti-sigma factor RsiW
VTCREFADFIAEFLDGELPETQRRQFEQHLSLCVNCARYLESYRESIALGKRAFEDRDGHLPGDVPEELVDAILRARRSASPES